MKNLQWKSDKEAQWKTFDELSWTQNLSLQYFVSKYGQLKFP